jgi:MFS superfamily sulfate permease-like transporter
MSFTGGIVNFISLPIITGFTSAAAISIAAGQLKVNSLLYQLYLLFTVNASMHSIYWVFQNKLKLDEIFFHA